MNSIDLYETLQAHLNKMPVGYPKTESGVEISLLKKLFTPREALIATNMNLMPENSKKIYRRVKKNCDLTIEELDLILTEMDRKGLIIANAKNGEILYANIPLVMGMYEFQLGRLTPEVVKDVLKYLGEAFIEKEYNLTRIPQLRTIPIETAITPELNVASYDVVREIIINSKEEIGLMDCICRKAHDLINDSCKRTNLRKTCISFGSAAKKFHEKGVAQFISKDEALNLIKILEKEGLVPQPSNSQRPMIICHCCSCCCEFLSNQKKLDAPARFFASNFQMDIDLEACTACGICIDICPMNALSLENDHCGVNLDRCIGCGLCVSRCTNNAHQLKKKKTELVPPKNTVATYKAIMDKKAELARMKKS